MATDLLLDIISFFTAAGVVQGDGIDAFRDTAPDTPDTIVVVYEYPGSPEVPQIEGVHRSLQIVARNKSATKAKEKARQIYKLFNTDDRILNVTPERWCMIYPRQTPFKIKVDSNERVYYGFNVGITTYND